MSIYKQEYLIIKKDIISRISDLMRYPLSLLERNGIIYEI
jgi:hypothetical protein